MRSIAIYVLLPLLAVAIVIGVIFDFDIVNDSPSLMYLFMMMAGLPMMLIGWVLVCIASLFYVWQLLTLRRLRGSSEVS